MRSVDFNKARFNVQWAGDDSGESAHMTVSDLPGAKVIKISAGQVDSGGVFAGFQVGGMFFDRLAEPYLSL